MDRQSPVWEHQDTTCQVFFQSSPLSSCPDESSSYTGKSNGIWNFTIPADHINPWGITNRNRYMLRLHDVPFPADWPGMEIKRIFENKLSKGGEQFGSHRLKLIQRTYQNGVINKLSILKLLSASCNLNCENVNIKSNSPVMNNFFSCIGMLS